MEVHILSWYLHLSALIMVLSIQFTSGMQGRWNSKIDLFAEISHNIIVHTICQDMCIFLGSVRYVALGYITHYRES